MRFTAGSLAEIHHCARLKAVDRETAAGGDAAQPRAGGLKHEIGDSVLYHSLRGLATGSRRVQIGRLRFIRPSRFNLCHHFFKMHSILAAVAARTLSIRHSGVPGRDYLN